MRYLNTHYKLFLENHLEGSEGVNKYEIVRFTENFTINEIYGGEAGHNISVNVTKGEKLKLYFDIHKSNENQLFIIGIRPLEVLEKESKKSEKTSFNLSELWEGNFLLDTPITVESNSLPFTIEKYL